MTISKNGKQTESADPHWIEWVTGTICTLLVAAMLGWIAYDIYRYVPRMPASTSPSPAWRGSPGNIG